MARGSKSARKGGEAAVARVESKPTPSGGAYARCGDTPLASPKTAPLRLGLHKLSPETVAAMKAGAERAAARGLPMANPPGSKPKPQKNVSLFDFLDLAKPGGGVATAAKLKGPGSAKSAKTPALAASGRAKSAPRQRPGEGLTSGLGL